MPHSLLWGVSHGTLESQGNFDFYSLYDEEFVGSEIVSVDDHVIKASKTPNKRVSIPLHVRKKLAFIDYTEVIIHGSEESIDIWNSKIFDRYLKYIQNES